MTQPKINIVENYQDLCEKAVQEILALSMMKIAAQGRFTMVLSGGSTPKGIYECMASPLYNKKFQWEKIHLFWGDERWVSPEDPRSNYRMVSEALLTKVEIPFLNIHPIQTYNCDLKSSVRLYEESINNFFKLQKGDFPVFDLILLGIGQDGHTASLFPGNPALLVKDALAVATSQEGIPEKRITLTLPAINHADMIFFLVSGPDKADMAAKVLKKDDKTVYPANQINPFHGSIAWFLDKAAASQMGE